MQDLSDRISLLPAAFEQKDAAVGEGIAPVFADGAVEVQTVHAAVQRLVRLEICDAVVELRHFAARDVGRIGNDDVERADAARGTFSIPVLSQLIIV